MATPLRITNSDEQREVERDLQHDRNDSQRIKRLAEMRRSQKKQIQPERHYVNTLNAAPKEEFVPLQSEEETIPTIRRAYEEEPEEDMPEEEVATPERSNPPLINPADISTIPTDLAQEREQLRNRTNVQQRQKADQAVENQIAQSQQELSKLTTDLKDVRKKEKHKKLEKEIIKLVVTSEAILTIVYYVVKIILIQTIFYRDGKEARSIKKQIDEKNKQIKALARMKYKTKLKSLRRNS